MKNKEESSVDLSRGSPSSLEETTGSVSRPGRTVTASAEQPALSLFPESLMEAVVDDANIELAWKNVRANRGAPGPDGISIAMFPEWFRPRWPDIRQQLLDGTYRPSPVRRKTIDKPDGGERQLGLPNVLDRLAFDRNGLLMEQPSKCNARSAEATASSWIWTSRNSSTGFPTTS